MFWSIFFIDGKNLNEFINVLNITRNVRQNIEDLSRVFKL